MSNLDNGPQRKDVTDTTIVRTDAQAAQLDPHERRFGAVAIPEVNFIPWQVLPDVRPENPVPMFGLIAVFLDL